ncbi:MAG: TylF/MycF/NovP-related O-methyltransferase [Planctomycetota bacterium]|nr:TylF/MycF/NovP-related O-methyltransferase [Planctomycetota bacterium]
MKTRDAKSQSCNDLDQFSAVTELFEDEPLDLIEKIEAFGKYASRQSIAKFLTKYEIFQRVLNVNGSIVECGVLHGAGLLTWAKLSSIFEPANHPRKVVGFDTFNGFPSVNKKDRNGTFQELRNGGLQGTPYEYVQRAVEVYDLNRAISHIPKVELVKGDLCKTADQYVAENPHLVVSLLYLDVDLYEPTRKALEVFVPRMPKGAIIAFDELNAKIFPGETAAVDEVLGLRNLEIRRFPFDSYVSYAVVS